MRVTLIACVGALALLAASPSTAQDKPQVLLFNFLNEQATLRFDDGQTCTMKSGAQGGECTVNLSPGRHEVKVQTRAGTSAYTIEVTAEGNEFWVTAAGVKRQ